MWSALASAVGGAIRLLLALLPNRDWKGGQAESDARHAEDLQDARERMDEVDRPDARSTGERLRDGTF